MFNKHISEYLDYYISMKSAPEYAVLLRGEWGSGKTWFIKNYIENSHSEFLYISLNGIASFNEIEENFFQQLHPILASKGMKLLGKIAKGVLKTSINIDIDEDGKKDGSVSASIPDLNLPDYLNNLENKILVFDDLERCSIPIQNVLGYINQFVESNGQKVIVLGNETEIKRQNSNDDEESTKYVEIKEKLIGKSFDIMSDVESAFEVFIEKVDNEKVADVLIKNKAGLLKIYNIAGYNNLRHLRLAILDFERFFNFIPEDILERDDILEHMLQLFFSISFELRKGTMQEDEIFKLFTIDYAPRANVEERTAIHEIREKYSIYSRYYHPVSSELLTHFYKYGTLDKKALNVAIKNSAYYEQENTADWIKLWRTYNLNDDEFEKLSKSVLKRFESGEISNKHELFQVSCLLIKLINEGLLDIEKSKILEQAKSNFEMLKNEGNLTLDKHEEFPNPTSHGLEIAGRNLEEINELSEFVSSLAKTATADSYPKIGDDLLKTLQSSVIEFGRYLTVGNSGNSLYYDVPILQYVQIDNFVDIVLSMGNPQRRELVGVFERRYENIQFNYSLKEEVKWLQSVHDKIEGVLPEFSGKVSGVVLQGLCGRISQDIKKLNGEEQA